MNSLRMLILPSVCWLCPGLSFLSSLPFSSCGPTPSTRTDGCITRNVWKKWGKSSFTQTQTDVITFRDINLDHCTSRIYMYLWYIMSRDKCTISISYDNLFFNSNNETWNISPTLQKKALELNIYFIVGRTTKGSRTPPFHQTSTSKTKVWATKVW